MTRPPHSFAVSSEGSSPYLRQDRRVRSNVHVQGFAERLFWDLHRRTQNNVGLYAWRPPSEELPITDHSVLLYLAFVLSKAGALEGRRRFHYHSLPLHYQPV